MNHTGYCSFSPLALAFFRLYADHINKSCKSGPCSRVRTLKPDYSHIMILQDYAPELSSWKLLKQAACSAQTPVCAEQECHFDTFLGEKALDDCGLSLSLPCPFLSRYIVCICFSIMFDAGSVITFLLKN